jgi:hypothetical protein
LLSGILFITTVLGFWKTINDQFYEWFDAPQAAVASDQRGPFRIAANENGNVEFFIKNQSISTRSLVKEVRCYLDDGQTNRQVFSSIGVVSLEKGEKTTQRIPLKISEPGKYVLRAEAIIKTGKFRASRTHTNEFQIQVWPDFAFEAPTVLQCSSNKCRLFVNFISGTGSTNQLQCDALLTNYQNTCFERISPTEKDAEMFCDPESKRADAQWMTPYMSPFQVRTFILYLRSDTPKSRIEWTNLAGRIELHSADLAVD